MSKSKRPQVGDISGPCKWRLQTGARTDLVYEFEVVFAIVHCTAHTRTCTVLVDYMPDYDGTGRSAFDAIFDDDGLGHCIDSGWTPDCAPALRVLRRDQARVQRAIAAHLDTLKPPPKALVQEFVEVRKKEIRAADLAGKAMRRRAGR